MAARGSASEAAVVVVAVVALIVLALIALRVIDTGHPVQQGVTTTIEIVLDQEPPVEVTVNGYHAVVKYKDSEGYHLVFVVPSNKTYVLSPACCSRLRYLTPGKRHYAYWLGGCVALRTDK
jgi:heme/copper-type cytochrome/quinol oxidase subunit 2